jgi:menaquinone-dependent protoporphyrinogen oxidase
MMPARVLIAFGSKYGSTKEIAEKIGEAIKQEGLEVDILSADKVKSLAEYQGVVIGSAAYIGGWRKEVTGFVKKNEKTLAGLPVWIFSSGPAGKGDPVQQVQGWLYPKALKPVIDNIKPRDVTVFHGNINTAKMNAIEKWMIKQVKSEYGDFRDWEAIAKWGKGIAAALKG